MSAETLPYNPCYIKVWTIISIVLGLFLMSMFVFGTEYLAVGQAIWDTIRYFATPII